MFLDLFKKIDGEEIIAGNDRDNCHLRSKCRIIQARAGRFEASRNASFSNVPVCCSDLSAALRRDKGLDERRCLHPFVNAVAEHIGKVLVANFVLVIQEHHYPVR